MTTEFKRMRQLIGSTADWAANDLTIGDGELAAERVGDVIDLRVGDGVKPFSQLSRQLAFIAAGAGSVPRSLVSKAGDTVSIIDKGADSLGVIPASAAITAALASAGRVFVPEGLYLIDAPIEIADNKEIVFAKGATFMAGIDGLVFFHAPAHAYFSQIWNATLYGNGHAGVTGFDIRNMRLQAGIFNASFLNMEIGIIVRSGCFGLLVLNPNAYAVPQAMLITENASVMEIHNPTFDNSDGVGGNGLGVGIDLWEGGGSNIGVRILGGFIQGFDIGVQDAALATRIEGTYFENCTTADVSAVGTRGSDYRDIVHFGPIGAAGYRMRFCDAATIFNPVMASGARAALYDVDASNTNCREYRPPSASSMNAPTGPLTYLGSLAQQTVGAFVPVVEGSGAAGAGSYAEQTGKWSRTGNVVHFDIGLQWSGHSGTGNTVITGLPAGLAPASYSPPRVFPLSVSGFPFTGPMIYATFSGAGTNIALQQASAAGAVSLVPMAAAGRINLTGSFEI